MYIGLTDAPHSSEQYNVKSNRRQDMVLFPLWKYLPLALLIDEILWLAFVILSCTRTVLPLTKRQESKRISSQHKRSHK